MKVERVEVKDVRLPVQLQRAMAAEAEAAREARAKVITKSISMRGIIIQRDAEFDSIMTKFLMDTVNFSNGLEYFVCSHRVKLQCDWKNLR